MLVFATATILLGKKIIEPGLLGWSMTVASVLLMIVSVRAYIVFLRHADELLRKVHLEALSLAFGAGVIAMMGYRLCERLGAPRLDIDDPFLVMIPVWALGQWFGMRRYGTAEKEDGQ